MNLWRLTRRPYAELSGRGGQLADGRWHTRGRPVVYCAGSAALAVLEVRVHLDLPLDLLPDDYVLMQIEAPDNLAVRTVSPSDLPDGWRSREDLCRRIGDAWLDEGSTAFLSVPSAILEVERNVLLNPRHRDAGYVAMTKLTSLAGTNDCSVDTVATSDRGLTAPAPGRAGRAFGSCRWRSWAGR